MAASSHTHATVTFPPNDEGREIYAWLIDEAKDNDRSLSRQIYRMLRLARNAQGENDILRAQLRIAKAGLDQIGGVTAT